MGKKGFELTAHTDFEGQVYILSKDEGGRHTPYLRMPNADCPEVWAAAKQRRGEPAFADGVPAATKGNG
jgi:hypothetical protein